MTFTAPPPLAARRVARVFQTTTAVAGVDLEVCAGEIHALVGLNGAGKSTLMKLLLGMLVPDAGQVMVLGRPARSAGADIWARVGHLVETPFAYPELTVVENLTIAARLHGVPRGQVAGAVAATLTALSLDSLRTRRAGVLSTGNRERLGLAAALVHEPEVLVLDEPTSGLDPVGVVDLRSILQHRAHDGGTAVLVSSHHFDEVARVADRITVMHAGRVVGALQPGGTDLERAFFEVVYAAEQGGR